VLSIDDYPQGARSGGVQAQVRGGIRMNVSETLCDLNDIKEFLELRKLMDEPKDNNGSGFTIGDVIDDLIYKVEEASQWEDYIKEVSK